MIILPIGHDHSIRRMPWVTIGIMVLCTLLQLHRTIFAPWPQEIGDVEREVQQADKALMISITQRMAPPPVAPSDETSEPSLDEAPAPPPPDDPIARAVQNEKSIDWIVAEVHAGRLGIDADPAVARVHAALQQVKALEKRDIAARMAYVPADGVLSITLVLSAFAHLGWLHLVGNLIFLWLCGCNLEDRWGRVPFGAFYVLAGIAGNLGFAVVHRHDGAGTVGASGAIAGAMGAFLVLFSRARIKWMYIVWWKPKFFFSPAYVAFPIWFLAQAVQVLLEASGDHSVAFSSHVGGFTFGLAVAGGLRLSGLDDKLSKLAEDDEEKGWEEHPDFVTALPLVETDPSAALPLLRKVLVDRPTHEDARWSLARVAARVSDTNLLGEVLPRAVSRMSTEQRWPEIVSLAQSIEPMLVAGKLALDERTSAQILHAAVEGGDPKLCVRLARGHQHRFAAGHTMPRVLWDVAMAQRRAGAVPQSQVTLQRIVDEFPTHVLAEKARAAIAAAA